MGWDEVEAVNEEIWENRQAEIRVYLDKIAANLKNIISEMDEAFEHLTAAYNGYDPGEPYPDSQNARAWDYVDAMQIARREIINRLETWDGYVR